MDFLPKIVVNFFHNGMWPHSTLVYINSPTEEDGNYQRLWIYHHTTKGLAEGLEFIKGQQVSKNWNWFNRNRVILKERFKILVPPLHLVMEMES